MHTHWVKQKTDSSMKHTRTVRARAFGKQTTCSRPERWQQIQMPIQYNIYIQCIGNNSPCNLSNDGHYSLVSSFIHRDWNALWRPEENKSHYAYLNQFNDMQTRQIQQINGNQSFDTVINGQLKRISYASINWNCNWNQTHTTKIQKKHCPIPIIGWTAPTHRWRLILIVLHENDLQTKQICTLWSFLFSLSQIAYKHKNQNI